MLENVCRVLPEPGVNEERFIRPSSDSARIGPGLYTNREGRGRSLRNEHGFHEGGRAGQDPVNADPA